jgi:hypothetical protein
MTSRTRSSSSVLILSEQPMIAALLGMLVELVGYRPAFAAEDERPEDAMRRVRPALVVLLDGTLDLVRSDLFFARAAQHRIALAIFGPEDRRDDLAATAERRGIIWCTLPISGTELRDRIEAAATNEWWLHNSRASRG